MTKLLEIKKQIFHFCGKYEVYLRFVYKFIIALAIFTLINEAIGFMESISTLPIALVLSLVCCVLPQSITLVAAAILIVVDLYVLSVEVAVTALLIFGLVFFLYFRFAPKDGVLFMLTPLCFALNIPYVLPIATGLLRKVYSVATVACGTIIFFFLDGIYENVTALQATSAGTGNMETMKMTITAGQLLSNKEMYLTVVVFIISAIVVHCVRKMSIEHAWKVAVVSGALVQISGLFVGYIFFDVLGKTFGMIIGNVVAILIGLLIEFMFMDLDYTRVERVQFEDDDYYYFVKAIPKKMVASSDKEIIQFSGFSTLERLKERRKNNTTVSRQQIVDELDIDEFLN